ncbi:MAG: tRNA pseudouridine(54/55) synthase Pus10 [Candidatus Diapherotrites archaeon CG11_big_fil_rev_8_21_14_0_20_37_9]|nr:MAG: tRNA pseudouridine(54/55) synthase Pus10 [Candidatus Diapherotrites archaeon CG11_big_fil_rev_8_21_14_0_20_37_9]
MKFPVDCSLPGFEQVIFDQIALFEFNSFQVGVNALDDALKISIRNHLEKAISAKFNVPVQQEFPDLYLLLYYDRGFFELQPKSIFVEGKYKKFSRDIAQTFHYCFRCKGRGCSSCNFKGKLTEQSVQELIELVFFEAFNSNESKFHGCGREDVDVLMLGSGRPFVIELLFPKKRTVNLSELEEKVNLLLKGKIELSGLNFVAKERVVEIKNTSYDKVYSALCSYSGKLSQKKVDSFVGKKISIVQRTPERVEKRRVDKERKKYAIIKKCVLLENNTFIIELLASHGLYVKEFISGDGARTNPSISSLIGVNAVCNLLDVIEVCFENSEKK